jgi:hypothetical protein
MNWLIVLQVVASGVFLALLTWIGGGVRRRSKEATAFLKRAQGHTSKSNLNFLDRQDFMDGAQAAQAHQLHELRDDHDVLKAEVQRHLRDHGVTESTGLGEKRRELVTGQHPAYVIPPAEPKPQPPRPDPPAALPAANTMQPPARRRDATGRLITVQPTYGDDRPDPLDDKGKKR